MLSFQQWLERVLSTTNPNSPVGAGAKKVIINAENEQTSAKKEGIRLLQQAVQYTDMPNNAIGSIQAAVEKLGPFYPQVAKLWQQFAPQINKDTNIQGVVNVLMQQVR